MLAEPKSDSSRRTIALPEPLIRVLQKHCAKQNAERPASNDWHDWDLVFCQTNGRPLDKHSDYNAWCALLGDGVRHIRRQHGLHSGTTLLLAAGVHPLVVTDLLGHVLWRGQTPKGPRATSHCRRRGWLDRIRRK